MNHRISPTSWPSLSTPLRWRRIVFSAGLFVACISTATAATGSLGGGPASVPGSTLDSSAGINNNNNGGNLLGAPGLPPSASSTQNGQAANVAPGQINGPSPGLNSGIGTGSGNGLGSGENCLGANCTVPAPPTPTLLNHPPQQAGSVTSLNTPPTSPNQ